MTSSQPPDLDRYLARPVPVKLDETSSCLCGLWWGAGLDGGGWLVDPHLDGQDLGLRASSAEPFGVREVRGLEVAARRAWTWAQVPSWTDAGVCIAMPECRCSVL